MIMAGIIVTLIVSLSIGFGFSIIFFVFALHNSNVLGEEKFSKIQYVKGIRYTDKTETRNPNELRGYVKEHVIPLSLPYTEPDPKMLAIAFDQETLEMFDLTDNSTRLDPLNPGFVIEGSVMQNRSVVADTGLSGGIEDEFEQWEKENGIDSDTPVFKPFK